MGVKSCCVSTGECASAFQILPVLLLVKPSSFGFQGLGTKDMLGFYSPDYSWGLIQSHWHRFVQWSLVTTSISRCTKREQFNEFPKKLFHISESVVVSVPTNLSLHPDRSLWFLLKYFPTVCT